MASQRRPHKFHLKDGNDDSASANDGPSRPSSPLGLQVPRSASPVQQRSLGAAVEAAQKAEARDLSRQKQRANGVTDIGVLDDEVYDRYLSAPVAWIRRRLVASLRKETPFLAWQQKQLRTPLRDRYFVYTSLLGTHSFFLIFLPMPYWMNGQFFARGLVLVLALGVYVSSAIKDWLCVPRPYSPPVTRLTIGTHHLEYGFPSTHSTNAVSIAAYVYVWILALRERAIGTADAGFWGSRVWEVLLLYYCCSVVYGRLYAGMHSIVDCVAGSALGIAITWLIWSTADPLERFLTRSDWLPPAVIIPLGLLMVSIHPQPLDDCPCFEDAIAFVAVAMGTSLGRWSGVKLGVMSLYDNPLGLNAVGRFLTSSRLLPAWMGSIGQHLESAIEHFAYRYNGLFGIERHSADLGRRLVASVSMMAVGVGIIVLDRIVVKSLCRMTLPSVIRFSAETFGVLLPRRHYKPATEYENIPALEGLRAVPSIIDLPDTLNPMTELGGRLNGRYHRTGSGELSPSSASGSRATSPNPLLQQQRLLQQQSGSQPSSPSFNKMLPLRPVSPAGSDHIADQLADALSKKAKSQKDKKKKSGDNAPGEEEGQRYDADVLTKVIVYFSIGWVASLGVPALFERIGWAP